MELERHPINSKTLKELFSKVYQDFFEQCSIVCSSPRSFPWFGEHTVYYEGMALRQALPLRTYVGLASRADKMIRVKNYISYDPSLARFQELHFDPYLAKKLEHDLGPFLQRWCGVSDLQGFDVYILSEFPIERALGGVGSFLTASMYAVLMLHRVVYSEDIALWKSKSARELVSDPKARFDYVFRTVWKWEVFHYARANAVNLWVSLLPSATPLLFFSRREISIDPELDRRIEQNQLTVEDLEFVDRIRYWIAKMDAITKEHVGWPLPFDYGIISSTSVRTVQDAIFSLREFEEEIKEAADITYRIVRSLIGELKDEDMPDFYRISVPLQRNMLWSRYYDSVTILSYQVMMQLKDIIEKGFSRQRVFVLFSAINRMQEAISALTFTSPDLRKMIEGVRNYTREKLGEEMAGVKTESGSRGGNLLFTFPSAVMRPWAGEFLNILRKQIGNDKISLDYASWIDGYEEEGGLKIEQWLEEGIHSPLLAPDAVRIITWTQRGEQKMETSARGAAVKKKHDLFFDCIAQQVHVADKACTSKELPSQKATVAIMDALLTTEGHRLHNRALPESGYAKYRNEFQGKITGPLVALVKKRLKKDLALKVEGTLTDFTVSLDPKGFSIGLVKKLQ